MLPNATCNYEAQLALGPSAFASSGGDCSHLDGQSRSEGIESFTVAMLVTTVFYDTQPL